MGDGYKDGFKEIPDHGYAPKHKHAYADITTPTPKHRGVAGMNKLVFQIAAIVFATTFCYIQIFRPQIDGVRFIKSERVLREADERYVDYLTDYYYKEINKIIDDEKVIAESGVKRNVSGK